MEAWQHGVCELARRVRRTELSAIEVAESFLGRIESASQKIPAFVTVDFEGARRQARRIDEACRRGADPGPLCGVPIGLKDNFVTKGLPTTCSSRMLRGWVAPYEGAQAGRLERAGAIILGKLDMDEFAMGSSNETSHFGTVPNPWAADRVPGGSSGGCAASVAAGLCLAALGSDTGGSVRQPAAFCGVTGVRPSYGRVSRYGLVAFASTLDQPGPLGRSARDCAALLEAVAGQDPMDSTTADLDVGEYQRACLQGMAGMTLGVPEEYFGSEVDAEVGARVREAISILEGAGAEVVSISLPHTDLGVAAYYVIASAEASSNLARFDGVRYGYRATGDADLDEMYCRTRSEGFGWEVKRRIMLGTFALSDGCYEEHYDKAQRVRSLICRDFAEAFDICDVIVTPTTPEPPFKKGARLSDPVSMYLSDVFTVPASLAGLPAMSVPCGFVGCGLPIGMQLVGAPFREEEIFRVAGEYQRLTDHHAEQPPLAGRLSTRSVPQGVPERGGERR
jgi:aspartyl-tRNA(Asn)/glutamyl-tRNA(Gln) amidotransferase subunit A